MPLHDWTDRQGWEGMHIFWMTEIARGLKATLTPGYRAVIGSSPLVAVGPSPVKPDAAVTNGTPHATPSPDRVPDPDFEVAVATLEEDTSVLVERDGRLVAAIELVSPRNKDRPTARDQYGSRYLNYLRGGVHLLIVDVHRRPLDFSFPRLVNDALRLSRPAAGAPSAASYRVGAAAAQGGRMLAVWEHPLEFGRELPAIPLALTPDDAVMVDLEASYVRAAADSYVE